jgi:hypothetical protein
MIIDLERLAVDLDYWDEVAPEGATHFMHTEKFVKWVDGVEWVFYASSGREWKKTHCNWMLKQYLNDGTFVLARPIKYVAPKTHPTDTQAAESGAQISAEWDGTGLPPVGCECEAVHFNSWAHVKIVAHVRAIDGLQAVHQLVGYNEWNAYGEPSKFRPIRSQAEREREQTVDASLSIDNYPKGESRGGMMSRREFCEKLYDSGMLRMPNGDVAKNAKGES